MPPLPNAMAITMQSGTSTTDRPLREADRRETIAISDNSPHRGRLSDPPLTNQPPNGLRQQFPGLIPARPYCADVLSDGLRIREKNWPSSIDTFN